MSVSDSEDKALHLVGMAYDAALDESKWPLFLEALAASIAGSSAFLRSHDTHNQSASFSASVGYDPAWQTAYCQHFVKMDYYNHMMNQYAPGTVISSGQHIDQRELRKTEYFNDYLLPQGKMHAIGTFLLKTDSQSLLLGIQRGKGAEKFGADEARMIGILAPHVSRAVQVHRKMHTVMTEKAQAQSALDRLRMGVILTNRLGMPLYLNRAAELMMTQDTGLGVFHNRLTAYSPSETVQLLELIQNASVGVNGSACGGDMRITTPSKADFLHCVVTPVSPAISSMLDAAIGTECVAIYLSKPGGLQLSPKRLVALYKITPAEARLAARLAALRSVEEASDDLGVSILTARTQLKSLFGKTGTRSQSELLMLLATGAQAHLNDE